MGATAVMSLSSACLASIVFIFAAYLVYNSWASKQTRASSTTKATVPPRCLAKREDCAYTTRRKAYGGEWTCPVGYEDTGCNWSDGKEAGKYQCRACGINSPYFAYGITNPNCPAGFIPCNDPKFNYGDLKKNGRGGYEYKAGWGVDDPGFDWEGFGSDVNGGDISLNKGKWGGTDAHPEVFAKGCCAFGNSTDDPQRDKTNKDLKIWTTVASGIIDAAAILAAPFTGGMSIAGSLALHAATTAVSVGVSTGGGMIRAKCGGPTVKYKEGKTKGRNYLYKGPYNDVAHGREGIDLKMRGVPGLWYQANNGCPLKWLQFNPDPVQPEPAK